MKAVYAGSFDPFTNGHLHVVYEASRMFETVYIVIAENPAKKRRVDLDEMRRAIRETCLSHNITNVVVATCSSLVADFAVKQSAQYLVRGIRNSVDYQYEESLAQINEKLGVKTIYIRAAAGLGYISSTAVMELMKYGKDVSGYVPEEVHKILVGGKT